MKELVIISGKGGTGKTSVTAAFASLAQNAVIADCDVDAADMHIILEPRVIHSEDFIGGKEAVIDKNKCMSCGRCAKYCRFGAVSFDGPGNDLAAKTYRIDPMSCEGCKVCVEICPVNAIDFVEAVNGQWFISETRFGPMVHARLGYGEENSGKLVSLIRQKAKKIATEQNAELIIVDGSPGTGCPVISSISSCDMVLVITEPTLSGMHDLKRVLELTEHFNIPAAAAINKADINEDISGQIEKFADEKKIPILGRIAYDRAFTLAQIEKKTITEYSENSAAQSVKKLWQETLNLLNQ